MPLCLAVAALLDRFHTLKPVRAWSLIITLYGDAVVPRGGRLWLGSLTEIMDLFGIDAGHVRTAMSRLTSDGWLERRRIGRNSYYRLSSREEGSFAAATRRIYFGEARDFDGHCVWRCWDPAPMTAHKSAPSLSRPALQSSPLWSTPDWPTRLRPSPIRWVCFSSPRCRARQTRGSRRRLGNSRRLPTRTRPSYNGSLPLRRSCRRAKRRLRQTHLSPAHCSSTSSAGSCCATPRCPQPCCLRIGPAGLRARWQRRSISAWSLLLKGTSTLSLATRTANCPLRSRASRRDLKEHPLGKGDRSCFEQRCRERRVTARRDNPSDVIPRQQGATRTYFTTVLPGPNA